MTFAIHNDARGAAAVGGGVWALGYGANNSPALQNSLVIELVDTYQDPFLGDTSANEISVHTNGTGNNSEYESYSIGRTTAPVPVGNGALHTARIHYVPGTLTIYVDDMNNPALVVPTTSRPAATSSTALRWAASAFPTRPPTPASRRRREPPALRGGPPSTPGPGPRLPGRIPASPGPSAARAAAPTTRCR